MKDFNKTYVNRIDELLCEEIYKDAPDPVKQRSFYQPLNRTYKLEVNKSDLIPNEYKYKVNVPFPLESSLSNYGEKIKNKLHYHYHTSFKYEVKLKHTFLNFIRINGIYKVVLNGHEIAKGIDDINLEIDVSDYLKDDYNSLDIDIVKSTGDATGITAPVFLNQAGESYIEKVEINVDFSDKHAEFMISSSLKSGTITIASPLGEKQVIEYQNSYARFPIKQFISYSPDAPFFYHYEINNGLDTYKGIFAATKYEVKDVENINYLTLNDKPLPIKGVISDTLYPFSINLMPSYTFIKDEMNEMIYLGFNSIYLKGRLELPYYYYNALLKGLLVVNELDYLNKEKFVKTLEYLNQFGSNYLFIINNKSKERDENIYKLSKSIVKDKLICVGKYKDINITNKLNNIKKATLITDLSFKDQSEGFINFMNDDYLRLSSKGLVGFYYNSFKGKNSLISQDNLIRRKSYKIVQSILKH